MELSAGNPAPTRLRRYLTVALRWLVIVLTVFILTVFAGLYLKDHVLHKVYVATAQIQINPEAVNTVIHADLGQSSNRFQHEFETMESSDILMPVITDLNLDQIWAKRMPELKESQLTPAEATAYLRKRMKLDFSRDTTIINITVAGDVPTEAAAIANAIADRYKTMRDAEQNSRADGSSGQSLVRIVSRADSPAAPTRPDRTFCFIVIFLVATFLSLAVASFVEMVFLFSRAAQRADN